MGLNDVDYYKIEECNVRLIVGFTTLFYSLYRYRCIYPCFGNNYIYF